jgi:hypothetical protein
MNSIAMIEKLYFGGTSCNPSAHPDYRQQADSNLILRLEHLQLYTYVQHWRLD